VLLFEWRQRRRRGRGGARRGEAAEGVAERRGRQVAVRRREGRGQQGGRIHRQLPPPPVRCLRRPEDAGAGGPRLRPDQEDVSKHG
jgi:hypothetical protein